MKSITSTGALQASVQMAYTVSVVNSRTSKHQSSNLSTQELGSRTDVQYKLQPSTTQVTKQDSTALRSSAATRGDKWKTSVICPIKVMIDQRSQIATHRLQTSTLNFTSCLYSSYSNSRSQDRHTVNTTFLQCAVPIGPIG